jgi:hypothetical protein
VGWVNELANELEKKHIRAGVRVNSRVELVVEWREDGRTLQAEGYTVDISVKGCLAIVGQGFPVGQKLKLTNKANGNSIDATLVWRGHEGRKGWELGLELAGQAAEFWGLDF